MKDSTKNRSRLIVNDVSVMNNPLICAYCECIFSAAKKNRGKKCSAQKRTADKFHLIRLESKMQKLEAKSESDEANGPKYEKKC